MQEDGLTFVTRARARVDRMACPWLVRRFIDRYDLHDPALRRLALIVRGADTDRLDLVPEAAGLFALASGFRRMMPSRYLDDAAMLEAEIPMYDALYEFCREQVAASEE